MSGIPLGKCRRVMAIDILELPKSSETVMIISYPLCQQTKLMNILEKVSYIVCSYMCIPVMFYILVLSKILYHFLMLKWCVPQEIMSVQEFYKLRGWSGRTSCWLYGRSLRTVLGVPPLYGLGNSPATKCGRRDHIYPALLRQSLPVF